jgi:RNA polymerase sigma factor (TIGR02999 family)
MTREVTELLIAWGKGETAALDELVPVVQSELHRIARRYMSGERPSHTLQPTALVNEVYLKLVDVNRIHWQNRAHFFGVAATLMRRILIDFARSRRYQKRGGGAERVPLTEAMTIDIGHGHQLLDLNEALDTLARVDSRQAQIVEMRFFAGMSVEEVANVLGVSEATVMRDWKLAKAWLMQELER